MSMLADLFPPERRTRAFAILAAQAPIGVAIGAIVAGFAREAIGWRGALTLVGVPGLLFAIVVWRTYVNRRAATFRAGPRSPPRACAKRCAFCSDFPRSGTR